MLPRIGLNSLVVVALVFGVAGCRPATITNPYGDSAEVADYGKLKLLKLVNDPRIKAEIAKLEASQQLPTSLSQAYLRNTDPATQPNIDRLLDQSARRDVEQHLADSDFWWSGGAPTNDLLLSARDNEFLRKWNTDRVAARSILLQPGARLPIDVEQGYLADPSWTGTVHCLARAELLHAGISAGSGNLDEAITAAAFAMAYADRLNQVPRVTARQVAIQIREEVCVTLRALLRTSQLTPSHLQTLTTVFQQTHQSWPKDQPIWATERACGLHFFEMVRAGHLASLLTREEYESLSGGGTLDEYQRNVLQNITDDQVFYLQAMSKLVAAAEQPYFERIDTLNELSDAVSQSQSSAKPLRISSDFLLIDYHAQQAAMAKDEAVVLTWLFALQTSTGNASAEPPIEPFSGKQVEVENEPTRVVARFSRLPGNIPELVIPKL